ncbi:MAG: bifunctional folylpolyglutamate synthase/dihydrofolate synthase [Chloroflexi bacterium]|nr:bifunctional folylpolyglutamate synthase/dihydrofolate synthase [Chloroflexota bacterium]
MMTYQETLDYLYSFTDYGSLRTFRYSAETFDLGRMRSLMAALGNPQEQYPILHVAGTKGKGSTSALCANALTCAGYRTGFYSSPQLQDFCERIQIDGEPIARDDLVSAVADVRRAVDSVPGLTTFELNTATAFLYYARQPVDLAVMEVGLGGRLDATNVITPLASVITSLSYDHMHLLGNTLAEIAGEKAGIIKPGVPVVSAPQQPEALEVIQRVAAERGAPLTLAGRDWRYAADRHSLNGQSFFLWSAQEQRELDRRIEGGDGAEWVPARFEIPLLGAHQIQNAVVAYAALNVLRELGVSIPEGAVREGFRSVRWPGRFEILGLNPTLVADCAHNGDSAQKLAAALDDYFPGRRVILLFGASADKDVTSMFEALLPRVYRAVMTQAIHPRALDPDEMAETAGRFGVKAEAAAPVSEALERALALAGPQDVVVAAGSVFVVAEVRAAWAGLGESATSEAMSAMNDPAGRKQ